MDTNEQKKIKRYKNGITSIWFFAVLSIVNVFMYAISGSYFVFSSSISILVSGVLIELGSFGIAVIASLILIAPYVVCAILAKKRAGAMITALILASIDTLVLVGVVLLSGDVLVILDSIFDLVFHVILLVELLLAVQSKDAVALMQKSKFQGESFPDQVTMEVLSDGQTVTVLDDACVSTESDNDSALANIKRSVTVTRKKAFPACLVKFGVVLDGVEVAKLKNGESTTIMVSGCSHAFCVQFANGNSDYLQIPAGTEDKSYFLTPVMKMSSFYIQIDEV